MHAILKCVLPMNLYGQQLQSLIKFIDNQCLYVIWVKCHKLSINDDENSANYLKKLLSEKIPVILTTLDG